MVNDRSALEREDYWYRSSLDQDKKGFERADKILNTLIEQLTSLIKNGFVELIETKEEDVWNE